MLEDVGAEEKNYLGEWHVFLPSEVCHGCNCKWSQGPGFCVVLFVCGCNNCTALHSRFASVYSYGFELFRQRFLGEEGATQLKPSVVGLVQCTCSSFHVGKPLNCRPSIGSGKACDRQSSFDNTLYFLILPLVCISSFQGACVIRDLIFHCKPSLGWCFFYLTLLCTSCLDPGCLCDLIRDPGM